MAIEKINDVKTVIIHKMCKCGGEFKPDGMCLMSNPPQYPHVCLKCGERETFNSTYPKLDYIEVEDDINNTDLKLTASNLMNELKKENILIVSLYLEKLTNNNYRIGFSFSSNHKFSIIPKLKEIFVSDLSTAIDIIKTEWEQWNE